MNGLQRLFLRITPIIMLICFICFGITHAFQQENQPSITYLTHEVIAVDDNNTPNDTTDDITIDNYSFDLQSYRQNIDINILKRATTNIIDIETYTRTLQTFNYIWEDGYQFGDGIQTIINSVILVINTLIMPINVVLAPVRIVAGILLTAFSIVGININRNTAIIRSLNVILDQLAIPFINPTYNADNKTEILGTIWTQNNTIWPIENDDNNIEHLWNINMNFHDGWTSAQWTKLYTVNLGYDQDFGDEVYELRYLNSNNDWYTIYNTKTGWQDERYKTIIIDNNNDFSDNNNNWKALQKYLLVNATQVT